MPAGDFIGQVLGDGQMSVPVAPTCPKCGSTVVTLIASHKQYPFEADRNKDPPTSENFAYQCQCGMAFTVMVKLPTTS